MLKKLSVSVVFLSLPVAILTIAIIHSRSVDPRPAASLFFQAVEQQNPSADGTPLKRSPALAGILKMGAAAVPTLQEALKAPGDYYKFKACWVLEQMGATGSNAVPELVDLLDNHQSPMRICAMLALISVGTTRIDLVPRMVEKLQDGQECGYAASLLDKIQLERKANRLPPAFANDYDFAMLFAHANWPSVRVRALPKFPLDDKRSMAAFGKLLNDSNPWVRVETTTFLTSHQIIVPNLTNPTGVSSGN